MSSTIVTPATQIGDQSREAHSKTPRSQQSSLSNSAFKTPVSHLSRALADQPETPLTTTSTTSQSSRRKSRKTKVIINHAPTQELEIYVVGTNEAGELGLGRASEDGHESRLLINAALTDAGVVQCSVGGSHAAALTADGRILTWGVNDLWALGRDTKIRSALRYDAEEDLAALEDMEINLLECTPTSIETLTIPKETVFTQVMAGDNATFAVTDEGEVYGWGAIRVCT